MESDIKNLPLFRASIVGSKKYAIGHYHYNKNTDTHYITYTDEVKDGFKFGRQFSKKIEIDTLAISFSNMLDSNNERVFASLQKSGKGGDKCDLYLYENQETPTRIAYTCRYNAYEIVFNSFNFREYYKIVKVGIQ